jgi:hypothetical protein
VQKKKSGPLHEKSAISGSGACVASRLLCVQESVYALHAQRLATLPESSNRITLHGRSS